MTNSTTTLMKAGDAKKIADLTAQHGRLFRNQSHRIRITQVGNFYGRAVPRQRAILASMQSGCSYAAAYKQSEGLFDTKRWSKVVNRTASARGILLTITEKIRCRANTDSLGDGEIQTLRDLVHQIADEANILAQRILDCKLQEIIEEPRRKRKSRPEKQVSFTGSVVQFAEVRGQLSTAIAKLSKTARDVPQMLEQLGELPTAEQIEKTLLDVDRIVKAVPMFLAAIESVRPVA